MASPIGRSHCPHKSSGLWPPPLKTTRSPKTLLAKCPCGALAALSPEAPEPYLEDPLQRLHIAAFTLHDGAQDVPPDHLHGQRAWSVPAPTAPQSQHGTQPACGTPGAWSTGISFQGPPQRNTHAPHAAEGDRGPGTAPVAQAVPRVLNISTLVSGAR